MLHIEVRVAPVKTWMKRVKETPTSFRDGTTLGTDAPIVNRMAPGVVEAELCSPTRETPTINPEVKGLVTRMTSIFTNIEGQDVRVQSRAAGVIRADGCGAVVCKPGCDAARIE